MQRLQADRRSANRPLIFKSTRTMSSDCSIGTWPKSATGIINVQSQSRRKVKVMSRRSYDQARNATEMNDLMVADRGRRKAPTTGILSVQLHHGQPIAASYCDVRTRQHTVYGVAFCDMVRIRFMTFCSILLPQPVTCPECVRTSTLALVWL